MQDHGANKLLWYCISAWIACTLETGETSKKSWLAAMWFMACPYRMLCCGIVCAWHVLRCHLRPSISSRCLNVILFALSIEPCHLPYHIIIFLEKSYMRFLILKWNNGYDSIFQLDMLPHTTADKIWNVGYFSHHQHADSIWLLCLHIIIIIIIVVVIIVLCFHIRHNFYFNGRSCPPVAMR